MIEVKTGREFKYPGGSNIPRCVIDDYKSLDAAELWERWQQSAHKRKTSIFTRITDIIRELAATVKNVMDGGDTNV